MNDETSTFERPQAEEKSRPADLILSACVVLALLLCGGLLVYGSGRGLDFTDEVFYLIWTRDPNAYALIYQPFGYLLNPLFKLVRGDLQIYRLSGFAIAAGAGAFLGYSLLPRHGPRVHFMLYGAVAALTIFYPSIVTPSYNSAANVGALLIIGGVLSALAGRAAPAAVAAAVGLCLAAFSKPPLFAIAVSVILIALVFARRRRTALALIAALVLAAVLICLFLAPADIPGLVTRMIVSQHVLALPNTPLALPGKIAGDWRAVPWSLTGATVTAGLSFALRRSRWCIWAGYPAIALSMFYIGSIAADAIEGSIPDFIGLALVTTASGYAGVLQGKARVDWLAIGLLLGAPLAVALGTFNNQWAQLNFSMAFPFLALFALASADRVPWRRRAAQSISIIAPVSVMLLAAEFPYSLPASIFAQQVPIRHPLARGSILVDPETAGFVRSAHGLAAGALLVDLSGTGPGVAVVLGGRAPVLPWLNPATETWPDVVWSRLSAKERERAWFVDPILPLFVRSAPARWLIAHETSFCRRVLPPMTFWGEERELELWRPCPELLPVPWTPR